MKELFQTWLEQHARRPGVLACGVRLADRTCLSLSHASAFPAERLDKAWHRLTEVGASLAPPGALPTRCHWQFGHAQIHYVTRPDGISLGLFTAVGPEAGEQGFVDQMVEDFLCLGQERRKT